MAAQKHMPIAIGYGVVAPIEPTIWAASPASAICRKPDSPEAAPAACGSTLTAAAWGFPIASPRGERAGAGGQKQAPRRPDPPHDRDEKDGRAGKRPEAADDDHPVD